MGFEPFYPQAVMLKKSLPTWGKFVDMPIGVTVHYTADDSLERTLASLRAVELGYHILIERNGFCHQGAAFTERVYHAGKALWQGKKPNSTHIAVSLVSWGKLSHGKSWRGDTIPDAEIVERASGQWHRATAPQEAALMDVLKWATDQGIDPRQICGHDECALPPGRKVDPGGILDTPVSEIRKKLIASFSRA